MKNQSYFKFIFHILFIYTKNANNNIIQPLLSTQNELLFLKMASRESAEAGSLGLEDFLLPAESDCGWEPKSTASACEMKVSDDRYNKVIPEVDPQAFPSSCDLLTELRQVHALDEMIAEETLKIHVFRQNGRPDEEPPRSEAPDSNGLSVRKAREAFRRQLEKEKEEVDKLERSLESAVKARKQKDESKKVIRCSVMEKTRTEEEDDESHATHAAFLVCRDSEPEHKPDCHEEVLDLRILTENASNQLPASQADDFECETLVLSRKTSDVKPVQPPEGVFSESPTKPEASLTPELRPDDGAFDPGGNWHVPPVPKPRSVLLARDNPSEDDAPSSVEMQIPSLPSVTDLTGDAAVCELPESSDINHSPALSADVKEHQTTAEEPEIPCFPETDIKDKNDTSVEFKGLEEEDLELVEEMRTLSPASQSLLPESPPDLELSGRDYRDEDLAECVQPSDWLKVSGCESADREAQLDISIRKVILVRAGLIPPRLLNEAELNQVVYKAGYCDFH